MELEPRTSGFTSTGTSRSTDVCLSGDCPYTLICAVCVRRATAPRPRATLKAKKSSCFPKK